MALWRLRQYVTAWDAYPFRNWYRDQDGSVQAATDVTLGILKGKPDWLTPKTELFKLLLDDHRPMGEVRFTVPAERMRAPDRRIRLVGLLRPAERDFILFGAAREVRGRQYDPTDGFDNALRHYQEFIRGRGHLDDYDD